MIIARCTLQQTSKITMKSTNTKKYNYTVYLIEYQFNNSFLQSIQDAEFLIENCFKKLKSINMDSFTDDECVNKVRELIKTEAKLAHNPYFDMLIDQSHFAGIRQVCRKFAIKP